MRRVIEFFVDNWKFSFLLTGLLVVVGLLSTLLLQKETFPPVNFAQVTINTRYPGASPEEVLDRVTKKIEDELRGIAGIKDVKSVSQNDSSEIGVRIDIDRSNSEQVVNEIQRAVQRASTKLPPDLPEAPLVSEIKAKEIPIFEIAVIGPNQDRQRDKLVDRLKESIENVEGISNVRLSGYKERELQILLDRRRLSYNSVGLAEVTRSLSARIKNVPAGRLGNENVGSSVRVMGKVTSVSEVENLFVRSNDSGQGVKIKDIARVVEGEERPRLLARINGQEATLAIVTKKEEADALDTLAEVKAILKQFTAELPAGFSTLVYNDEGRRIDNRLNIVSYNAVSGLVIVILVLFLFLPGAVGVFSSLSLPICALTTVALMVYYGANFNIITMLAIIICLGNLVDNSVVISESYASMVGEGVKPRDAAVQAASQYWIPFTASTITIISAFIPMLVTKGVLGQFIRWIPIVVAIALTVSLIEAITVLPARLQFLKPKNRVKGPNESQGWFSKVEDIFGKTIRQSLKFRYTTMLILTSFIVSGFVATALFNRFELFPADGVEFYVARYEAPPETSIERTDHLAAELSKSVVASLGEENLLAVVARTGNQLAGPGDARSKTGENVGILMIAIKPEVAFDLNINDTLKSLRTIPKPEGFTHLSFETEESGPPVGKPLTVSFRSSQVEQLRSAANLLKDYASGIEGVRDVEDDEYPTGKEVRFIPNERDMSFAGLNVSLVGDDLRAALEGFEVAKLTENGREYSVKVKYAEQDREAIESLSSSLILNQRGNLVPLGTMGKFETGESPRKKKNFDFLRSITVTADVDPKIITSAGVNQLVRGFLAEKRSQFPDVNIVFGGEEESTNDSLKSLAIALILAVFGIFATLVFTFKSFSKPLLILSTIPLGLIGVFYSFIVDQRPLSFLAFIGVVGLSGVVINSAIILVDYIEELRRDKPDLALLDLLELASAKRLRAVLATGLTTVVGLMPTAFGLGGTDPILVPITLALSWGMIVGTILSLIWIPASYMVLEDFKLGMQRLFNRSEPRSTKPRKRDHGLVDVGGDASL